MAKNYQQFLFVKLLGYHMVRYLFIYEIVFLVKKTSGNAICLEDELFENV
jgi:hypothetical protein